MKEEIKETIDRIKGGDSITNGMEQPRKIIKTRSSLFSQWKISRESDENFHEISRIIDEF